MATGSQNTNSLIPPSPGETRAWQEFAIQSFARIVARKHGVTVPLSNLQDLSDEELENRLQVIRELAHLPPA